MKRLTLEEFKDKHKLRGEAIEVIKECLCLMAYNMYCSDWEVD